jgi:hypothetical protein
MSHILRPLATGYDHLHWHAPCGTERLRFTPGPAHAEAIMRDLTSALIEIWQRLELRLAA